MAHGKIYGKKIKESRVLHTPVHATLSTLLRRQNLDSEAPPYF